MSHNEPRNNRRPHQGKHHCWDKYRGVLAPQSAHKEEERVLAGPSMAAMSASHPQCSLHLSSCVSTVARLCNVNTKTHNKQLAISATTSSAQASGVSRAADAVPMPERTFPMPASCIRQPKVAKTMELRRISVKRRMPSLEMVGGLGGSHESV